MPGTATPKRNKKADKVREAGASHVLLTTGKRGKYHMGVHTMVGWNPATDRRIDIDDDICSKPWLVNFYYTVERLGNCLFRTSSRPVIFWTHHCLSRLTQRWEVRNLTDMLRVIKTLSTTGMEYIVQADKADRDNWYKPRPMASRFRYPIVRR
jgi:hypothetical protein